MGQDDGAGMSLAEDLYLDDGQHPIDLVETLAATHAWDCDRLTEDQIAMTVEGLWRTYALTLAWNPGEEVLRLICTFEMEPPEARAAELLDCVNRCNDMVWTGAFTWWADQKLMVWRYGLTLAGGQEAGPDQLARMISGAITACERFYPAFQLVSWADRAPAEAIKVALAEAWGRA